MNKRGSKPIGSSNSGSIAGSSSSSIKTEISDEYLVIEQVNGKNVAKMENTGIDKKQ